MKLRRHFKNNLLPLLLLTIATFACQKNDSEIHIGSTGTVQIEITDAPIDNPEVRNAFITISSITFADSNLLNEKSTVDLLAYQNGNTKNLGSFTVPAKTYDHIELKLDLQEDAFGSIPGCYVATQQGKKHNLYPSSNLFKTLILPLYDVDIAPDGQTNLVLDFDLRKLIRYGNISTEIKYQFIDDRSMEESIRVIDKNAAGNIKGMFLNETGQDYQITVFAYQSGTFNRSREIGLSETDLPYFFGAINSTKINGNGDFIIPFLPKGSYELIFSASTKDGGNELIGILNANTANGSDITNVHVEPGNDVTITGSLTEILPF